MSGTKDKADKQKSKRASAQALAEFAGNDGARLEPAITLPGHYIPSGAAPIAPAAAEVIETTEPASNVEALAVCAIPAGGFWRCGRFWPTEQVHVFVSDDPEADNAANNSYLNIDVNCFISRADAERLKAEPRLRVTPLETVTESE